MSGEFRHSRRRLWQAGAGASVFVLSSLLAFFIAAGFEPVRAQTASGQQTQDQQNQSIPDAPSTVQPSQPPPEPPPQQAAPEQQQPQQQPQAPPASNPPANSQQENVQQPEVNPGPRPPINIRTVPEGGATQDAEGLYKLPPVIVNQVMVPVTVTDEAGHLVSGLASRDFTVLENNKKQKLNFFTSDPFALSAAVIVDTGMKDVDLQKVNHTFPALEGAFSQFDEVSLYTFSNEVAQVSNWAGVGQRLTAALDSLSQVRGQNNGPAVTDGPMGPQGPYINGRPVDPAAPTVYTPVQEAHVLNDAMLRAALDLSQRDKSRRKVIFIISDGREYRSSASYRDVLRLLLTNNILVYAIDPGGSALPGYNTLSRLHIPRLGYGDILPKYVNATTGGQVLNALTRTAIEDAYSQALGDARNQYTMGYITHAVASGSYRDIEVLVDRPSCKSSIRPCVNVSAKAGYYPAPPAR